MVITVQKLRGKDFIADFSFGEPESFIIASLYSVLQKKEK